MRASKIRELDDKELTAQSAEIRDELFRLRLQMGLGQMDALKKYRRLKKDQARILGVLRERELAVEAGKGN